MTGKFAKHIIHEVIKHQEDSSPETQEHLYEEPEAQSPHSQLPDSHLWLLPKSHYAPSLRVTKSLACIT